MQALVLVHHNAMVHVCVTLTFISLDNDSDFEISIHCDSYFRECYVLERKVLTAAVHLRRHFWTLGVLVELHTLFLYKINLPRCSIHKFYHSYNLIDN